MEIFTAEGFSALLQVIAIDLVLAGDNAIVIGLAAAGLPADQRKKAILVGIGAATVLRIVFALVAQQLMAIGPVLLIAGGLLLLYVCWKMWRELRGSRDEEQQATEALDDTDYNADGNERLGPADTHRPGQNGPVHSVAFCRHVHRSRGEASCPSPWSTRLARSHHRISANSPRYIQGHLNRSLAARLVARQRSPADSIPVRDDRKRESRAAGRRGDRPSRGSGRRDARTR